MDVDSVEVDADVMFIVSNDPLSLTTESTVVGLRLGLLSSGSYLDLDLWMTSGSRAVGCDSIELIALLVDGSHK